MHSNDDSTDTALVFERDGKYVATMSSAVGDAPVEQPGTTVTEVALTDAEASA